jgi:hypothetical protein
MEMTTTTASTASTTTATGGRGKRYRFGRASHVDAARTAAERDGRAVGTMRTEDRTRRAEMVLQTVCDLYSVTPAQLRSKNRHSDINEARQIVMTLLYEEVVENSMEIGAFLARDHTTVMYGLGQIAAAGAHIRVMLDLCRDTYQRRERKDRLALLAAHSPNVVTQVIPARRRSALETYMRQATLRRQEQAMERALQCAP